MSNNDAHWSKTKTLMMISLLVLGFFGFAVPALAGVLNGIVFLGFPLGFFLAAQVSLIAFVALIFWFASRQDSIDRKFGVAEDD